MWLVGCCRLSAAAASTIEELKTQGRAGLEHAIGQRKVGVGRKREEEKDGILIFPAPGSRCGS